MSISNILIGLLQAECVNDLRQLVLEFTVEVFCIGEIFFSILSGRLWKSGQKSTAHFSTTTTTTAIGFLPALAPVWVD